MQICAPSDKDTCMFETELGDDVYVCVRMCACCVCVFMSVSLSSLLSSLAGEDLESSSDPQSSPDDGCLD